MRRKGFTLIELMIVVAIIAIIAAVAIPGLLRSRIGSNEASAVGSLKAILNGQEQFKTAAAVDTNSNGMGEYGFLEELGGLVACRDNAGGLTGPVYASSSFIPRVLGNTDTFLATGANDISAKAGYNFRLFLPDNAVPPAAGVSTYAAGAVDAGYCEASYIAYASPQTAGRTGVRVFVIDPQGQPYAFPNNNTPPTYTGVTLPAWDAALNAAGTWDGNYIDDGNQGQALAGANQLWVISGYLVSLPAGAERRPPVLFQASGA